MVLSYDPVVVDHGESSIWEHCDVNERNQRLLEAT